MRWPAIVTILFGILGSHAWRAPKCDTWELLDCGNRSGGIQGHLCASRNAYTKRILSVHLDLRFPNHCCRINRRPVHFGLTASNDAMWVDKGCQGTFVLCLELDNERKASDSITYKTLRPPTIPTVATTDLSIQNLTNNTEKSMTTSVTEKNNFTVNSTTDYIVEPANGTMNNWNVTIDSAAATGIDPHTKTLLMAAIIAGGFILCVLILTILYLIMHYKTEPVETTNDQRFFRQPKNSTSALITSEYHDQSVYDMIPCDTSSRVIKIVNLQNVGNKNNRKLSPEKEPMSLHHNYFTVLPHKKETDNESTNDAHIYSRHSDHEYDHLQKFTRSSVSDSSLYSHLSTVKKEQNNNQTNTVSSLSNKETHIIVEEHTDSGVSNPLPVTDI